MAQTQIKGVQIKDNDLTSDDIADAAVRGATGNAGTQREIATGTVSTPDLRDASVSPTKIDSTATYTMTKLQLGDGSDSSGNFALGFTNSSTMGISRSSSGIKLNGGSASGSLLIGNGNIQITGQIIADSGTSSIVALNFGGDTDTGFYRPSSRVITLSVNTADTVKFSATGIKLIDGTNSSPSYSFLSDTSSGFYRISSNTIGVATNGTLALSINSSQQLNLNSHKIINLTDPTGAQDAATKNYVDTVTYVSVKTYGAVGNGTTDDTAAIQAAHDAIVASGIPNTLEFPAGTYKCTSTLTFNFGFVNIKSERAILNFSSVVTDIVAINLKGGNGISGNPYNQIDSYMAGLKIQGPGSGSNIMTGLYFNQLDAMSNIGPAHTTLRNLNIQGFKHGIRFGNHSYLIAFDEVDVRDCVIGVYSPTTDIATNTIIDSGENISFNHGVIYASTTAFQNDNGSADFSFNSVSFDGNGDPAINVTSGQVAFHGCHFETSNKMLSITGNTFVTISGCFMSSGGSTTDGFITNHGYLSIIGGRIIAPSTNTNIVFSDNRLLLLGTHFQSTSTTLYTVSGNYLVNLPNSGPTVSNSLYSGSQFQASIASVGSPSFTFSADSDTGMYEVSSNVLGFSSGGTQTCTMGSYVSATNVGFTTVDGSAATPSYAFNSDTATGFYRIGTSILGLSIGGAATWRIETNKIRTISGSGLLNAGSGSASLPTYSFENDNSTGLYSVSSGNLGISISGTEILQVLSTGLDFKQNQAKQLVVHLLASNPGSPVEGQIWYNTTTHQWVGYNGTSNVLLG